MEVCWGVEELGAGFGLGSGAVCGGGGEVVMFAGFR